MPNKPPPWAVVFMVMVFVIINMGRRLPAPHDSRKSGLYRPLA